MGTHKKVASKYSDTTKLHNMFCLGSFVKYYLKIKQKIQLCIKQLYNCLNSKKEASFSITIKCTMIKSILLCIRILYAALKENCVIHKVNDMHRLYRPNKQKDLNVMIASI